MRENELVDIHNSEHENQLETVSKSDFKSYLMELGLPYDNILAPVSEKEIMAANIPKVIIGIPDAQRKKAIYLSKFVTSVAIGRYDSALNDLWNEVVVSLRDKVCLYGLDIFFDAAVGENIRNSYNSEDDLSSIKDRVLIDTCLKLEIISSIVHSKLVHILDMRNNIGGSHPNDGHINSYELLGWLQVSVNEVISDTPSEGAIKVQQFIKNLREKEELFTESEIATIADSLKNLSTTLSGTILRTIFGIYTDLRVNNTTKQNILKIAPIIWELSPDNIKYDLGNNLESYIVNLDEKKKELGESFFEHCNGNSFKPNSRISLELTLLIEELQLKHNSWDNFHHEMPVIRKIMSYLNTADDIPTDREENLIYTVLLCRIGNGVSYHSGVSPNAKPYYNQLLQMLNNKQLQVLLKLLKNEVIFNNIDQNKVREENLKEILKLIRTPLGSERVVEIIDYLTEENAITLSQKLRASKYTQLISLF